MKFTVIIPARYHSTRLPGKPLLDLGGKPMIQHVVENARLSEAAEVCVATDDPRIADCCRQFGGSARMTSPRHRSGSDRIAEAAGQLQLADDALIVNVQGDEPLLPPAVINQVARNLHDRPAADICTLFEELRGKEQIMDPGNVKVVTDNEGFALYFSRAPIPFQGAAKAADSPLGRNGGSGCKKHLGIYAYRVGTLRAFAGWPHNELEDAEKLEQLRALANNLKIHVDRTCEPVPASVDTPADLERVRQVMASRA